MVDLVEALLRPEAYEEKTEKVELIQTHISWVFLTGNYVYKVKKPVDFEFLDFTTLEKRKFYCEEEVRVNRPLCGDMYVGVVPVNEADGKIKIGGRGRVVDYAVKMKQLPQEAIMTNLLKEERVTEEHIDKIAKLLADFHAGAKTGKGIDEYGSLEQIRANWIQNFEQTRFLRGNTVNNLTFDFIETNIIKFIDEQTELFNERKEGGRIRECHGDVHSGNIFIPLSGEIYVFDAIEFNKAFSCSDVAAEVAFLAMDLEFYRKEKLAEHFVRQYVRYSRDRQLIRLMSFYKCYRAYVRAKVTSFRLNEKLDEKERKKIENLTKKYFNLAYQYAKDIYEIQFNVYLF